MLSRHDHRYIFNEAHAAGRGVHPGRQMLITHARRLSCTNGFCEMKLKLMVGVIEIGSILDVLIFFGILILVTKVEV
jgi:hypothetical protein